jgi:NADH:ubiquinone oxidoreductase subunit F (NADH-binding)/Pyruvate/2-oxoacid:ferredoxin oxidoreductase delta subunit/(2Fe-2S) ferredoxin
MNLIKEHLPLLLMNPEPEKGNPVLQRNISKIRHQHVDKMHVFIGMGSCGIIAGADKVKNSIINHLKTHDIDAEVIDVGCIGLCTEEPIIDIQIPGRTRISFSRVTEESAAGIIDAVSNNFLPDGNILGQYQNDKFLNWEDVPFINKLSFFKAQNKILTINCGRINPESIDDAIVNKGYSGFIKAITTFTSAEVCQLVSDAKLKGRSGSAYLTGKKWMAGLEQPYGTKYLICNADESDPGAFVDKHLAEGDPHQIIEGIAIAAYAIQATKAIIYIRNQYQLAIVRLKKALKQAYEYNLLGDNIFNSGFNLDISLKIGPGAHVCGEETALIASLEGKRGMPETKPPYPVHKGLFGKPTVVNNLETLANVPHILKNGAEWFRNIGTDNSHGTKLFSISGKIARTGVVEIEMGTKIRDILQTAGGVPGEPDLKAVHIGGPSGGMIDTKHIDLPIDYEEMETAGLRMGSGSFLVLDEKNCILNLTKYFMRFIQQESCGKCIPCREGSQRMLEILERITQKPYHETGYESLERFKGVIQLESLAKVMQETSLCGLGQYAPNPVLSALKYFRDEFEEHIFDRKCQAGVCKGLKSYIIDVDICTGCTVCAQKCPADAIIGTARNPFFIVQEKCIGCGECYEHCKFNAISIK